MKTVKELQLDTLTTEQKIGLLLCANLNHGEKDVEDALEMIREHRLGAVWVTINNKNRDEILRRVRETADYPILIFCDAEDGFGDCKIPAAISLSAANGREEYAYAFGRATSAALSAMGYNVVCNPVLDRSLQNAPCGGVTRSIGPDKEVVARLGAAVARGMHDGGTLSVAKHYPSAMKQPPYDTHMREGCAADTREDLINESLYPYRAMIGEGVLDGVMVGHTLLPAIDPDRPACLSKKVTAVLRDCGFEGFYITDGLNMMGVVLKYGNYAPTPMAVGAGCDIPLSWGIPCREAYDALCEGYRNGTFTEEQMNTSVARILAAQHKVTLLAKSEGVREEDRENVRRLNRECISAHCADGVSPAIDPAGKHLFVLTTNGSASVSLAEYDAFANEWYRPPVIADRIRALFPNSEVVTHPEHPDLYQNMRLFRTQEAYDDIVFITATQTVCFVGREHLTHRTVDMMDALQSTDRIVAHLHFGNPFVATDAPYVPRVLLGWGSEACIMNTLDILAGNAPVVGTQPYADLLAFHKKGDIFY